ncbi:hypothetical protein BASA81_002805 [Batrachochytrium salamandrivorans]|nr:hypothetical protein BASA81_002805 [Batrachochytrium salamandrivorans]
MCECDAALVLRCSTRLESHLRACRVDAGKVGLSALAQGLPPWARVAVQIIAAVRNRFCHHAPQFLSPAERDLFLAKSKLLSEWLGVDLLTTVGCKKPRLVVDLTLEEESKDELWDSNEVIDLLED